MLDVVQSYITKNRFINIYIAVSTLSHYYQCLLDVVRSYITENRLLNIYFAVSTLSHYYQYVLDVVQSYIAKKDFSIFTSLSPTCHIIISVCVRCCMELHHQKQIAQCLSRCLHPVTLLSVCVRCCTELLLLSVCARC